MFQLNETLKSLNILYVQGDTKRLLKVHVSKILTFFHAGDLKFCTEQLHNYTI